MTAVEALSRARSLFLDSAPVIYFVEAHPRYLAIVEQVFSRLDQGSLSAATSPVTLAECLVGPRLLGDMRLNQEYFERIVRGANVTFTTIDDECARSAADLRARYHLSLTDAFQVASALSVNCDCLLTNDRAIKRVREIEVLVLEDLVARSSGLPSP